MSIIRALSHIAISILCLVPTAILSESPDSRVMELSGPVKQRPVEIDKSLIQDYSCTYKSANGKLLVVARGARAFLIPGEEGRANRRVFLIDSRGCHITVKGYLADSGPMYDIFESRPHGLNRPRYRVSPYEGINKVIRSAIADAVQKCHGLEKPQPDEYGSSAKFANCIEKKTRSELKKLSVILVLGEEEGRSVTNTVYIYRGQLLGIGKSRSINSTGPSIYSEAEIGL